jgi:hypothetical protein
MEAVKLLHAKSIIVQKTAKLTTAINLVHFPQIAIKSFSSQTPRCSQPLAPVASRLDSLKRIDSIKFNASVDH